MFSIVRISCLRVILLQVNFFNVTIFVIEVFDHIQCADIFKYSEVISEGFNIFGFHRVLDLDFQGYGGVFVPLVDLEDFIKIIIKMYDIG